MFKKKKIQKEIKKKEKELDVPPEKPKSFLEKLKEKREAKKKDKKEIKLRIPFLKKKEEKPEIEETPIETPEEILNEGIKKLEEEPKKGLVSQLKELNEKIDIISDKKKQVKKLKKKKFKIPFKVKSQLKKLAVKNKVQVMLLQRTRNIKPVIGEIIDGMLVIKDMVYNGSVDSTWLWNGKYPTHIVPEWDLQPMTPEGINEMKTTSTMSAQELHNYCIKFGRSAVPGKIILRAIEAKQNQMLTGKASVKGIILTVVIVIIVMAILFGGGFV